MIYLNRKRKDSKPRPAPELKPMTLYEAMKDSDAKMQRDIRCRSGTLIDVRDEKLAIKLPAMTEYKKKLNRGKS